MKTLHLTIIILVVGINTLNANIIYKNIDSTISATPAEKNKSYILDIDNDGINDFSLKHTNDNYLECGIYNLQSAGEIQVNQNSTAYICAPGQIISDVAFDTPENMYYGMGVLDWDWKSGHENLLAMRFQIDSVFHYGWIKVKVPTDCSNLQIIDCAYEETPGASIPAGQITGAVNNDRYIMDFIIYNKNNEVLIVDYKTNCIAESIKIFSSIGDCYNICNNMQINNIPINQLANGVYWVIFEIQSKIIRYKFIIIR